MVGVPEELSRLPALGCPCCSDDICGVLCASCCCLPAADGVLLGRSAAAPAGVRCAALLNVPVTLDNCCRCCCCCRPAVGGTVPTWLPKIAATTFSSNSTSSSMSQAAPAAPTPAPAAATDACPPARPLFCPRLPCHWLLLPLPLPAAVCRPVCRPLAPCMAAAETIGLPCITVVPETAPCLPRRPCCSCEAPAKCPCSWAAAPRTPACSWPPLSWPEGNPKPVTAAAAGGGNAGEPPCDRDPVGCCGCDKPWKRDGGMEY